MERLSQDKCSSLLQKFVTTAAKSFITLGPGDIGPGQKCIALTNNLAYSHNSKKVNNIDFRRNQSKKYLHNSTRIMTKLNRQLLLKGFTFHRDQCYKTLLFVRLMLQHNKLEGFSLSKDFILH